MKSVCHLQVAFYFLVDEYRLKGVEKPLNGTGKVLFSNSAALNGITILFGHFYPQSFPEKEMTQFPATNGRLYTCVFP